MAKELAVLLCLAGIVLATDKGSPVKHDAPQKLTIAYPTATPSADTKPHYDNQEVKNDQDTRKLVTNTDPTSSIVRDATGFGAEKKTGEEAHQQETRPATGDYVYGLFVPYSTQPHQQYGSAQVGQPQAIQNPEQFIQGPLNVQPAPFDFASSSLVPQPQVPFHFLGTPPYHQNVQNVPAQPGIVIPQSPYPETAHQSITPHLPRTHLPHLVPYPVAPYPSYYHPQGVVNSLRNNYGSAPIGQIGHRPVQFVFNPTRSPETASAGPRSAAQIPFLVAPPTNQHIKAGHYRPEFQYVYAPTQNLKPSIDSRAAIEAHQPSNTPSQDYAALQLGPLSHLAQVQHSKPATYHPSAQYIPRTPLPYVTPSPEISYPVYYPTQRVVNGPEDHHVSTPIAQIGHRSVQIFPNNIESSEIVPVNEPSRAHYLSVTPSPVQHIKSDGYRPELQYLPAPKSKSKQSLHSRAEVNEARDSISAYFLPSGKALVAPKLSPYIYSAAESRSQDFIEVTKRTPISDSREIPVNADHQDSDSRSSRRGLYTKAKKFSPASDVSSFRYKGSGFSYDW